MSIIASSRLGKKRVGNNWFASQGIETTSEWIESRTGIVERCLLSEEESLLELAVGAAVDVSSLDTRNKVDIVVVATSTASDAFGDASKIAKRLYEEGLATEDCVGIDLRDACAGFVDAIVVASKLVKHKACIVGADALASNLVDWNDRSTCILFGDGAGAIVLETSDTVVQHYTLRGFHDDKYAPDALIAPIDLKKSGLSYGATQMRGSEIFAFVTATVPPAILDLVSVCEWTKEEVDFVVLHQANARITSSIAEALDMPLSKFPYTITKTGNLGAASIPVALSTLSLKPGDKLILAGFGAGLRLAVCALVYNNFDKKNLLLPQDDPKTLIVHEKKTVQATTVVSALANCLSVSEEQVLAAAADLTSLGIDSLSAVDFARHFPGAELTLLTSCDTLTALLEALGQPTPAIEDPRESFEVTPLQYAMLFHHSHTSPGYFIMSFSWKIKDSWHDEILLRAALSDTINRHEALRLSFHFDDDTWPVQRIHPAHGVNDIVRLLQFADASNDEKIDIARDQREAICQDLEKGMPCLFRLTILNDRLIASFHHLIVDGISIAILMRDLDAFYHGHKLELAAPRWRDAVLSLQENTVLKEKAGHGMNLIINANSPARRSTIVTPPKILQKLKAFAQVHCPGSVASVVHAAFVVAARASGFAHHGYLTTLAVRPLADVVGPALSTLEIGLDQSATTLAELAGQIHAKLFRKEKVNTETRSSDASLAVLFDFQGASQERSWLRVNSCLEDGALLFDRAGAALSVRCVRTPDDAFVLSALAENDTLPADITSRLVTALNFCLQAAALTSQHDKPLDLLALSLEHSPAHTEISIEHHQQQQPVHLRTSSNGYTETIILEAAQAVLGIQEISTEANLFSLGVDSLKAMRIIAKAISNGAPRTLTLRHLFEAVSIKELARATDEDTSDTTILAAIGTKAPFELIETIDFDSNIMLFGVGAAHFVGLFSSSFGGAVAPQIAWEWCFEQDFNAVALLAAFRMVIARHPVLRSAVTRDGMLRVVANDDDVARFDYTQCHTESIEKRRLFFESGLAIDSVFEWPLFAVGYQQKKDQTAVVHLAISLFLMDAVSDLIFRAELSEAYEAIKSNNNPQLAPVSTVSFARYSQSLVESLPKSSAYLLAQNFWQDKLNDPQTPRSGPILPRLSTTVSPRTTPKFRNLAIDLDNDEWARLKSAAASNHSTVPTALLTAYALALARHSEKSRFLLNVLLCIRYDVHPDILKTIGNASSTVVVDIDLTQATTLAEAASNISASLAASLEASTFSGTEVMAIINRQKGTNFEAVAPFVFTTPVGVEDCVTSEAAQKRDWSFVETAFSERVPHSACVNAIKDKPEGGARISFDVVDGLFPDTVIDSLVNVYASILRRGLCQPEWTALHHADLWKFDRMPEALEPHSTGPPTAPRLLHESLFLRETHQADDIYLILDGMQITYKEVARRSRHLALRLVEECNISAEELIVVVMQKGWQQVVAVNAILFAGGGYVPADAKLWPAQRVAVVIESSGARIVIADDAGATLVQDIHHVSTLRINERHELAKNGRCFPVASPQAIAYCIYTSGSTGRPKGVLCHHRGAANTIDDLVGRFALDSSDRVLGLASLAFDLSVFDIFGAAAFGGCLVLPCAHTVSPPDPSAWLKLAHLSRVTIWNSVPALLEVAVLAREIDISLPESPLKLTMVSGDVLPSDLPLKARTLMPSEKFVVLGGATEAAIWSNFFVIDDNRKLPSGWTAWPYGSPLANQTICVLDDNLRPVPPWQTACIFIGGVGVAQGYKNDPVKNQAQFIRRDDGEVFFRTGDLGRLRECHGVGWVVEILGREDLQVKINGFRVECGDVEHAVLQGDSSIRSAACAARDGVLYAFVVAADPVDVDALRSSLMEALPSYMVPSAIIVVDALPLSSNGKVARDRLLDSIPSHTSPKPEMSTENSLTSTIISAADEIESVIRMAMASALDMPAEKICCRTGDFFRIGGSSLAGLRLLALLAAQDTKVRLSVRDLLAQPTVCGLAALIRERDSLKKSVGPAATTNGQVFDALELRTDKAGPILILCNPAGASGLAYVPLARSLKQVSVLALDDGVVAGRRSRLNFDSIADAAKKMASKIRSMSDHRQIFIGGYSYGGVVAMEAAVLLGNQVDGLIIIDAPLTASVVSHPPEFSQDTASRHFAAATSLLNSYHGSGGAAAHSEYLECPILDLRPAHHNGGHFDMTGATIKVCQNTDHWTILDAAHSSFAAALIAEFIHLHARDC